MGLAPETPGSASQADPRQPGLGCVLALTVSSGGLLLLSGLGFPVRSTEGFDEGLASPRGKAVIRQGVEKGQGGHSWEPSASGLEPLPQDASAPRCWEGPRDWSWLGSQPNGRTATLAPGRPRAQ